MPFNTELTRRLGIEIPVVQGGMQWVGYAELAAAVSNAGGLGIVRHHTQSPRDCSRALTTPPHSSRPSHNRRPKTCAKRSADARR